MKRTICTAALAATLAFTLPVTAWAASAALKSPEGSDIGTLALTQTRDGVRISGTVNGLTPGAHAFHIHAVGKCEPPFKSAGGHFNPFSTPHGKHGGGPHGGDMENLTVGDDGKAVIDVVNAGVTLNTKGKHSLFDANGSAVVIHAGADDYSSQPSGAAGARVACGVIQ